MASSIGPVGVSATFTAVRVVARLLNTETSFDDAGHVIGHGADQKGYLRVVRPKVCRSTEHHLTARVTGNDCDGECRFGWLMGTRCRPQPF